MNNLLRYIIPAIQFYKKNINTFFISILSVFTIAFIVSCSFRQSDSNYGLRDQSADEYIEEEPLYNNNGRKGSKKKRRRSRNSSYSRPEPTKACDTTCEIARWCADTFTGSEITACKTLVTADDINTIKDSFSSGTADNPLSGSDRDKLLAIGSSDSTPATRTALDKQEKIFDAYLAIYGGLLPNLISGASEQRAGAIIHFLSESDTTPDTTPATTLHRYTKALLNHTAKDNPNENLDIVNALLKKATFDEIPNGNKFPRNVDNFGSKKYDAIVVASTNIKRNMLRADSTDNNIVRRYSLHQSDHDLDAGGTIKKVDMRDNPDFQEEYKRFFKNTNGDITSHIDKDIFSLSRANPVFFELAYKTLNRTCYQLMNTGFISNSVDSDDHNYCITFVTCWSLENSQKSTPDHYLAHYDLSSVRFPISRIKGNAADLHALNALIEAEDLVDDTPNDATSFTQPVKDAVDAANTLVKSTSFRQRVKDAVDDVNTLFDTAATEENVFDAQDALNYAINDVRDAVDTTPSSCVSWRDENDSRIRSRRLRTSRNYGRSRR